MGQYIVAEAVLVEGVERTVGAIDRPIPAEFLRAEDEDPLVFQFEVFDDRERGEGFPEADAIGENAAIGGENRGFARCRCPGAPCG